MFSARLAVAFILAAMAMATPISRATPDCSTILSGTLAANATGVYKAFTLNIEGQIAHLGDGKSPLIVDFQECQSIEVGEPHDIYNSGQLYVLSEGKCIGITNQSNAVGPYYTQLIDCNVSEYANRFSIFTNENNALYWSGDSDEEGTIFQGGCGQLGYKSHSKGVPTITHSNSQITIECSGTPFRVVASAS